MPDGLRKSHLRKSHQVGLSEVGLPEDYHFIQARLEKKGEEKKADCSRRAKRIRERIEKRKKFSV